MIGWAIYELTPAPWGEDYRFIVIRDTEEAADEILNLLNKTEYSFSTYKIVEFKR